jgi:hypothetical protein
MNLYSLPLSNSALKPHRTTTYAAPPKPHFGVNPQPPQYLLDRYGYDNASVILAATHPRNFRTETRGATIYATYDEALDKLNDTFHLSPPLSKAQFAELQELNSPRHREKLEAEEQAAASASENTALDTHATASTTQKMASPFHKALSTKKTDAHPADRQNTAEEKTNSQTRRYNTRRHKA